MPLFVLSVADQLTAKSAGIDAYPALAQVRKDSILRDSFTREVLNPAGGYALYTTNFTGAGSTTMLSNLQLQLTTTAAAGDDADVRTSGISFIRTAPSTDKRTQLIFDIVFLIGEATATRGFIGLVSETALTVIPTTARHLGINWDTSVDTKLRLSSGNGAAQVTTATAAAIQATSNFRLRITWTGDDAATLELYTTTSTAFDANPATLDTSQTVTSFTNGTLAGKILHFFVENPGVAARNLFVLEWQCEAR